MSFILCPKCKKKIAENSIFVNANAQGRVQLRCPGCMKRLQFSLRGKALLRFQEFFSSTYPYADNVRGYLRVVENIFGYSALLPLAEGLNTIGRYNGKGTTASLPILSDDPSMDRNHCCLWVSQEGVAELMDNDSMTGTFVNGVEILQPERCTLQVGDTITLGATTLIYLDVSTAEGAPYRAPLETP